MASDHTFPTWALVVLIVCVVAIVGIAVFFSVFFLFSQTFNPSKSISITQAKQSADNYIAGSPDLKVAEIEEYVNNFYVRVQERDSGINAFELLVDRTSGAVMREPGPDMMWNTKYGMMDGMMGFPRGSTADMPVSADNATEYAQRWLDTNIRGAKAGDPDTFYGYYTMDILENGSTYGMLSVNGYSGDVWYHTWHGQFIAGMEYDP